MCSRHFDQFVRWGLFATAQRTNCLWSPCSPTDLGTRVLGCNISRASCACPASCRQRGNPWFILDTKISEAPGRDQQPDQQYPTDHIFESHSEMPNAKGVLLYRTPLLPAPYRHHLRHNTFFYCPTPPRPSAANLRRAGRSPNEVNSYLGRSPWKDLETDLG